jgi:hypothetical protein
MPITPAKEVKHKIEQKPILKKIEQILRKVRDNGWLLGKFSVAIYPPGNSYLSQIHQLFEAEMQQQAEEIFKEIPKVFAGTLSLQELKDKFTNRVKGENMRKLEEIQKSILEAEPGKLADTVNRGIEDMGPANIKQCIYAFTAMMAAAIANIDERLKHLERKWG